MTARGQVLVVDDDRSLRLLCRVNLEFDGYTVIEAESLGAAREAVARDDITAVLLDVHVGSENGIDLLDELKRDRPGLPVVLLTGESGLPAGTRGRADAVVSKPFEVRDLGKTIARVTTA